MNNNETIPKIVHRTVPKIRTALMEKCWKSVIEHTDGWVHMTHEDDDEYEIVGPYLDLCKRGAFRADLIRLEVLYKYGGVYLDSDVELFRSIEPLLNNKIFIAGERNFASDKPILLINAVMGTVPNNKIILEMIDLSLDIIKNDGLTAYPFAVKEAVKKSKEPYAFGPYVAHTVGMKYDEVEKLDPISFQTFFPIVNTEVKYLKKDSEVYGRHIYAGSWLIKEDGD